MSNECPFHPGLTRTNTGYPAFPYIGEKYPENMGKYDTMGVVKHEWRGAVSPALAVANHHRRMTGMGTVRIPLHSRKYPNLYATIDEEDYELVSQYRWSPTAARKGRSTQYAQAYMGIGHQGQVMTLMHRLILNPGKGVCVDHIDGDGLNNSRGNLRIATTQQNLANMAMSPRNTSGYKGVVFHSHSGLWHAQVSFNYKPISAGYFKVPEDAARAYDAKAVELFGEYALTNKDLGLLPEDDDV